MKESINILIENQNIIKTDRFKKEVLSYGNVLFFDDKKIYPIKCINRDLRRPENYRCCEIECKKLWFTIFYNLVFWKIVKKFDEENELLSYFFKLGLNNDINISSSIIYQFPTMDFKKFKSYEFPIIEDLNFREKSRTIYEIPQYIQDIPDGFSIFCTIWEASKIKHFIKQNNEEQEKIRILENSEEDKKDDNIIELNEPAPKTNFCYICQRRFDNYLIHIEAIVHQKNLTQNPELVQTAQNTFKRINQFWKNKEKLDNKLKEKKNLIPNVSPISSMTSLQSSNSGKKHNLVRNLNKNKNIFIIDLESSEIENINNENKMKNKNIIEKKDNKIHKKEDFENKEKNSSYSIFDCNKNSLNLLNKKRKIFEYNSENEQNYSDKEKNEDNSKEKDYYVILNVNGNKRLIGNLDVYFN